MALTFGANLIWGTSFVAISAGLEYSNPYLLLFERFFVACVSILAAGIFVRSARVWPELPKARTWILGSRAHQPFSFPVFAERIDLNPHGHCQILAVIRPISSDSVSWTQGLKR